MKPKIFLQGLADEAHMAFGGIAVVGDPWMRQRLEEKALEYRGRVIALLASGIVPEHREEWKLWDSVCKQGVAEDVLARGRTRRGHARGRCGSLVRMVLDESGITSHTPETILNLPHPNSPQVSVFANAYDVIKSYVKNRGGSGVYGGTGF